MARPEKIRLGDLLIQQGLLTDEQLKFALEEQKRSGRKLGRIVVESSFVTEEAISQALARQLQVPFVDLKHFNPKQNLVNLLPEAQARRFRAVVLDEIPDNCTAVGVPARVVRRNGAKIVELDQVHIPDPVAQELCRLEYKFL